jgi:hypothetical protein
MRANPKQLTPKQSVALAQSTWPKITEQVNSAFPQLKRLNSNQSMTIYSIFIQAKYFLKKNNRYFIIKFLRTKLEAERKSPKDRGEPQVENDVDETDIEEIKIEPLE